jgi:serine/threonine-protein kinase HipA
MTSEPTSAFVWIWLPGALEPIVCGQVDVSEARGGGGQPTFSFFYAKSYLGRDDAVAIYPAELPLQAGRHPAAVGWRIGLPLCIDDSMPDSWGRQVINHRLGAPTTVFGELTYLLESGSDRMGALDFQRSHDQYVARGVDHPHLDELAEAARRLEAGLPLSPELEAALAHGNSLGGARPKALVADDERQMIAKFSSNTDVYPVVQGEFVAMTLARKCGLDVAPVELRRAAGRYALLVERFDREPSGARRRVVSALTILKLNTFPEGRYANYVDLADAIRAKFVEPDATLRELFGRISFNMLCSNTDDHGHNHAAFVVGDELALTPAYDICPQARSGATSTQAMAYTRPPDAAALGQRDSKLALLLGAAAEFHLDEPEARELIDEQVQIIRTEWAAACDEAELTAQQRDAFMGSQFLNKSVFEAL